MDVWAILERWFLYNYWNPPYGAKFSKEDKTNLKKSYLSIVGKYDSFGFFTEKSYDLLRNEVGILSFILPNTWLDINEAKTLREIVVKKSKVLEIVLLKDKVFETATVNTMLILFQKSENHEKIEKNVCKLYRFIEGDSASSFERVLIGDIPQDSWIKDEKFRIKTRGDSNIDQILTKMKASSIELSNFVISVLDSGI